MLKAIHWLSTAPPADWLKSRVVFAPTLNEDQVRTASAWFWVTVTVVVFPDWVWPIDFTPVQPVSGVERPPVGSNPLVDSPSVTEGRLMVGLFGLGMPRLFPWMRAILRAALCMAVTDWMALVVRARTSLAFWRAWVTEGGVKLPGTLAPDCAAVYPPRSRSPATALQVMPLNITRMARPKEKTP
jgi:hypothetical protein